MDETRRKGLKLKSIYALQSRTHQISGATAFLGARQSTEYPFVVGWHAYWQKQTTCYDLFPDEGAAQAAYKKLYRRAPPLHPDLTFDRQKQKVYNWQDKYISRGTQRMNLERMRNAVNRLCDDFNMVAPDIAHEKGIPVSQATSWYDTEFHEILMQHNHFYLVLHEFGHALDTHLVGNKWSGHGPSFVRVMSFLAERYHYETSHKLDAAAKNMGIEIGPKSLLRKLQP